MLMLTDIAETAVTFTRQAARYADHSYFNVNDAFDVLFATIERFDGRHFQSAAVRRCFVEAVNIALSSIPGNQVSIRSIELNRGAYAVEWLPHTNEQCAKAGRWG